MKVFEYMATGKPVVATRLNSIEEIVDDTAAFLVEPGNARVLAEAISKAVLSGDKDRKTTRAREFVQTHTWQKRAQRLTEFFF